MSWLLLTPVAVLMLVMAACFSVHDEEAAEEATSRLDRVPRAHIWLACRQLPADLRADLGGERRAELHFD